ncbi:MAG: cobalamin B12-binding domain-containing protein [Ignavibacteriae bacterium]|nr:cobalamin B12-binding domain-containing protein [Ignavibacteriota bacterium]
MQKTILSTADVARLFNVTETTVKRWANDGTLKCMKTPGGHRKFEMKNVVDFAETLNFEPSGTLSLTGEDALAQKIQIAVLSRDFSFLKEAFLEKALSPDKQDMFVFFGFLYQHKIPLSEIYEMILKPGMTEIGNRWERGVLTVDQEHRASYETLDALAQLQTQIHIQPPTGLSMLAACPGDEPHELGLRCVSYLFESEGWRTDYIGARTPFASVLNATRELRPRVVCLSRTLLLQEEEHQPMHRLINDLTEIGVDLFLGGPAFCAASNQYRDGAHMYCSSAELLARMKAIEKTTRLTSGS